MSTLFRIASLSLLAVLIPSGPPVAQDEEIESPGALYETPFDAVENALKPIRDQVINMQAKIDRGVGSAAPSDDPDAPPVTGWAATCCTRNLRTLHDKLPELGATAVRLGRAYREAGRKDGFDLAGELYTDTEALGNYLARFAGAPTRDEAGVMLEHVVRAVMNLNIDHRRLKSCCNDVVVPVAQESLSSPN